MSIYNAMDDIEGRNFNYLIFEGLGVHMTPTHPAA